MTESKRVRSEGFLELAATVVGIAWLFTCITVAMELWRPYWRQHIAIDPATVHSPLMQMAAGASQAMLAIGLAIGVLVWAMTALGFHSVRTLSRGASA